MVDEVIGAGRLSTGRVVSRTVTLKLALPVLPAWSLALQLTNLDPKGKVDPEAASQLTPEAVRPDSCSLTASAGQVTAAPLGPVASAVTGAGAVNTGALVSILIVRLIAAVLPPALLAEQLSVRPTDDVLVATLRPAQPVLTRVSGDSSSTIFQLRVAALRYQPLVPAVPVITGVMVGALGSVTVTLKDAVLVLPALSLALQLTAVDPRMNELPEAGVQPRLTASTPESVSTAVGAAKVTGAVLAPFNVPLAAAGGVNVGGVPSSLMLVLTMGLTPPLLVAVQVKLWPAVSVLTELSRHPVLEVMADSLSVTDHFNIVGLVLYH